MIGTTLPSHSRLTSVNDQRTSSLRNCWPKCRKFIANFNLFASSATTNPVDLQNQRISTRIFIVLLGLSTIVLFIYNLTIHVTNTITIDSPSYAQYQGLYSKYPDTLSCPCSQISIEYQEFFQVEYTMHQVCGSVFVSDDWINYLKASPVNFSSSIRDFRRSGVSSFQTLRMFCQMTEKTIRDNLIRFSSSKFVDAVMIAENIFRSQIEKIFEQFISRTVNNLRLYLDIARDVMQTNAIWSARLSNFGFYFLPLTITASIGTGLYSNCRCDSRSSCKANFYLTLNNSVTYLLPNLYMGCHLSEALLQSTLECFYDQTCISVLQSYLNTTASMLFSSLDASQPSRFFVNSTINELVQQLMVEQWNLSIVHQDYFDQCRPSRCSYSFITHYSLIYIITNAFGLIGGLATILELIVPITVKSGRKLCQSRYLTRSEKKQLL